MSSVNLKGLKLSDRDFDFLVDTVSPEVTDKLKLKAIIMDDDFRNTFISDKKVFRRVMYDEEIFLLGLIYQKAKYLKFLF